MSKDLFSWGCPEAQACITKTLELLNMHAKNEGFVFAWSKIVCIKKIQLVGGFLPQAELLVLMEVWTCSTSDFS